MDIALLSWGDTSIICWILSRLIRSTIWITYYAINIAALLALYYLIVYAGIYLLPIFVVLVILGSIISGEPYKSSRKGYRGYFK